MQVLNSFSQFLQFLAFAKKVKTLLPIFHVTRQLILRVLAKVFTFAKLKNCETAFGKLSGKCGDILSYPILSKPNLP